MYLTPRRTHTLHVPHPPQHSHTTSPTHELHYLTLHFLTPHPVTLAHPHIPVARHLPLPRGSHTSYTYLPYKLHSPLHTSHKTLFVILVTPCNWARVCRRKGLAARTDSWRRHSTSMIRSKIKTSQ